MNASSTERLLRLFAVAASALALAHLPGLLLSNGKVTEAPIQVVPGFGTPEGLSGSMKSPAGPTMVFVTAVRFETDEWRPAGRLDALREIAGLPAGTAIAYRVKEPSGSARTVEGVVRIRPATPIEKVFSAALAALTAGFALGGLLLAAAGGGPRSLFAAGAFGGIALLCSDSLLTLTLVRIVSPAGRSAAVLLSRLVPFDLSYWFLFRFAETFPGELGRSKWRPRVRTFLFGTGIICALMTAAGEVPGFLERFIPLSTQSFVFGLQTLLRTAVTVVCALSLPFLVVSQVRFYRRATLDSAERRTARLAGWALSAGVLPALAAMTIQSVGLLSGRGQILPNTGMALALLPLLLIPATVTYTSLARASVPARLLMRRAAVFLLARRTIRALAFVPAAIFVVHLVRHRDEPISRMIADHPLLLGLTFTLSIAGLAWRESFQIAAERHLLFSRPETESVVSAVTSRARKASDPGEFALGLCEELARAFDLEGAALLLRDEKTESFRATGRVLPPLEFDAPSVAALQAGAEAVAPPAPGSASPAADREGQWAEAARVALLVPLTGPDGLLQGLLALGPKKSELPFDRGDRTALKAVAVASSLALENLRLRSSPGPASADASRDRPARPSAPPPAAAAHWCPSCTKIFPPPSQGLCPDDGSPLEPASVPFVFDGRYLFEKRIGAGGMGTVWKARDLSLNRPVAVKTLPRLSEGGMARIRREARAAARFLHPNLATIFTVEVWNDVPLLFFEYLDGGTLAQALRDGPLRPEEVVHVGVSLAGALEVAHRGGVLHRDIKPSNIGFAPGGTPKLLDFGLASVLDDVDPRPPEPGGPPRQGDASMEETVSRLTRSSALVGTVPYLSPEAVLGRVPEPGFDLWGLTLSLYEATTCLNPFLASGPSSTLNRILTLKVPDPRSLRPDCPQALADVLVRNLDSDSARRAATASILRAEFLALSRLRF